MKSRLPLPKAKIKKIVNDFVLPANIPYAYKRLIEVLKTVEKMRIAHGLVRHPASGDLVRGGYLGVSIGLIRGCKGVGESESFHFEVAVPSKNLI